MEFMTSEQRAMTFDCLAPSTRKFARAQPSDLDLQREAFSLSS